MKAAIYARISVDDGEGTSTVPGQIKDCEEYAAQHGYTVVGTYSDEVSGYARGNRPGFLAMERAAEARSFNVLLIDEQQRLSRGNDLPVIVEELGFIDVRVIGVNDSFDSAEEMAGMKASFSAMMGQQTLIYSSKKSHAGLRRRARGGYHTGGRIFGYQQHGVRDGDYKRYAVDDEQAAVVREIFTRFANGESRRAIARDLVERGIPSPRGGLWKVSGLHAMLQNARYTGAVQWNSTKWKKNPKSGKRVRKERAAEDLVTVTDETLRIVDAETWQRVRARDVPRMGSSKARPKYPLSGLLSCGECGHVMTLIGGVNSRGYGDKRYTCSAAREHGPTICSNRKTVGRLTAERLLVEPLREKLLADTGVVHLMQQIKNSVQKIEQQRIKNPSAHPTSKGPGSAVLEGHPPPVADDALLLESRVSAVMSAVQAGAISERDGQAHVARLRAEAARAQHHDVQQDEASLLADVERLRAAFELAAVDVLRAALGRLLGTVRCAVEDGVLVAYPEAHDLVLGWLGVPLAEHGQQVVSTIGSGGRI